MIRAAISTVGATGALLFCSRVCLGQPDADLVNLVFDPVPRAAATSSPIDPAPPSAPDRRAVLEAVNRHLAAIESLRRSPAVGELVEELDGLAAAYQALDRHEEALEVLDEAIAHVVDAGGRDSLEQVRLRERKIPSFLALGDIGGVDETEERIYALYARLFSPASRQMYYATINLADWHTEAYYRENYVSDSPFLTRQRAVVQRTQRCISAPGFDPNAESASCDNAIFNGNIRDVFKQDINDTRLRKIDRLYTDYQRAMIEAGDAHVDVVLDLAKRIARLAFATKQEMDFERDNYSYDPNYDGSREQAARNSPARLDESYDSGVEALKYAITVLRSADGVQPEAVVAALLNLGDWHLTYGKAAAAEQAYAEAYQALVEAGFSRADIDRALAAELPIQIPVFATHLYTRRSLGMDENAELDVKGYLDLSYTVDSLGNAHSVELLGSSADDAARIQRLLEVQLRSMKFRPVLRGGDLIGSGRTEARYYYAY